MITFACTRSKTVIPSILKFFHVAIHNASGCQLDLGDASQGLLQSDSWPSRNAPHPQLRPHLSGRPHCGHPRACLFSPVSFTHELSSDNLPPQALLCHCECNIHHLFTEPLPLFKELPSLEFPNASLSKVVRVLSLYLIVFYSPWLRPNFFKTYGWYHSSQHIMIRVMLFWFWLFSFVWLPQTSWKVQILSTFRGGCAVTGAEEESDQYFSRTLYTWHIAVRTTDTRFSLVLFLCSGEWEWLG